MAEVVAGFVTLPGGMDSSLSTLLLGDTQCARALNVTFRDGSPATRPAFEAAGPRTPAFGVFRGMSRWSLPDRDLLIMVIGAHVIVFDVNTSQYLDPFNNTFAPANSSCYFTQVHRFMVVQSGHEAPLVLEFVGNRVQAVAATQVPMDDGSGGMRTIPDIPPGAMGVYAHGRYHMVPATVPNTEGESGATSLLSGDIRLPDDPKTALAFSETEYLGEGGAHGTPLDMGAIGGLGVLRSISGTGYGSVVVFGHTGSCAFDFSRPRAEWKDVDISTVLFLGPGCRSPRSVIQVNNDLVYRGLDGLRTLKYTTQQQQGALTDTAISAPVGVWLAHDHRFLDRVSAAFHDNRVLVTAGADTFGGEMFSGLVAWDVLRGSLYDGLWTGGRFHQVVSATKFGVPNFYVYCEGQLFSLSGYNVVQDDPGGTPIRARIETKSYTFGDLNSLKRLQYVDLWFTNVPRTTEVKVWFRPHGYPLWCPLGERKAQVNTTGAAHAVSQLRFPVVYDNIPCDPATRELLYNGTAFQFAVEWTGRATLERLRVVADAVASATPDPCQEFEPGAVLAGQGVGDFLDDYDYYWSYD